jgi:hypothetical protein
MWVEEGATVTATRCDFMENGQHGVECYGANTKVRLNDSTIAAGKRGAGAAACAAYAEITP